MPPDQEGKVKAAWLAVSIWETMFIKAIHGEQRVTSVKTDMVGLHSVVGLEEQNCQVGASDLEANCLDQGLHGARVQDYIWL